MFYPFPNVTEKCLLCGNRGCSRWKGYYSRQVVCTLLGYAGPIAIHLAQCKTRRMDYSYWPDILVPFLEPSLETLEVFYSAWVLSGHSVQAAIDEVVGKFDEDYFIPLSVAYLWLKRITQSLILNQAGLKIRAPESLYATELRGYAKAEVLPIFNREHVWRPGQRIVFPPP